MSHTHIIIFIGQLYIFSALSNPTTDTTNDIFSTHLDIVFTLDTTGSMAPYITQTKKIIESTIKKYSERNQDVRFGIVAYRDFPPEENTYVTLIQGLTNDKKANDFISTLNAEGGGDLPEAVLTALYDSITKIQWRNLKNDDQTKYKKVIIHAGDAPPHGSKFSHGSNWPQGEPDRKTVEQVASEMNKENIFYVFCKITDETNIMESIFKELFINFSLLDNSLKAENIEKHKEDYEKYRKSTGKYKEEIYDYDRLSKEEKESIIYESEVANYMYDL